MSGSVRCFVAIELPAGLREGIAAFFARAGREIAGVRWAGGSRLHLTLKFLGELAADRLSEIRVAVEAAVAGHDSFALVLRGAGAFPSVRRPRVVWVGTGTGTAEASGLAASLEVALAPLGFAPEPRPFTPHLTVGRLGAPPPDRTALPRLIDSVRDRVWGETLVPAVHLVHSELFPAGPIYSTLAAIRLPEGVRQGR